MTSTSRYLCETRCAGGNEVKTAFYRTKMSLILESTETVSLEWVCMPSMTFPSLMVQKLWKMPPPPGQTDRFTNILTMNYSTAWLLIQMYIPAVCKTTTLILNKLPYVKVMTHITGSWTTSRVRSFIVVWCNIKPLDRHIGVHTHLHPVRVDRWVQNI